MRFMRFFDKTFSEQRYMSFYRIKMLHKNEKAKVESNLGSDDGNRRKLPVRLFGQNELIREKLIFI